MSNTISTLSLVGMSFAAIIAIFLPIVLAIICKKKSDAQVSSFFLGACCFLVFAIVIESFVNSMVSRVIGQRLANNIWLYALYGGLAAAFFEEVGRLITMKIFFAKRNTPANGIMFGIGHGGIEAILLVGFTMISNLVAAIMVNTGVMQASLTMISKEYAAETMKGLAPLWETESHMFFASGIERISAILLQISLAFIVYMAYRTSKYIYLALAFGIHFIVDFLTVIINHYINIWVLEVLLLIGSSLLIYLTFRWLKEVDTKESL